MTLRLLILLLSLSLHLCGQSQYLSTVYPQNNSIINDTILVFRWNNTSQNDSLKFTLSEGEDFTTLIKDTILFNIDSISINSLSFKSYYWKVTNFINTEIITSSVSNFMIFNPNAINALTLWLTADSNLTFETDSFISAWNDLSDSAFILSQNTIGQQPYMTRCSELNNKKVIHFSGGEFLSGGNILNIGQNSYSFFLLCKTNISSSYFLAKKASLTSNYYAIGFYANRLYLEYFDDASHSTSIVSSVGDYQFINATVNRNLQENKIYINNNLERVKPAIQDASYNMVSNSRLLIGAHSNSDDSNELYKLNGDIAEIIVIADTLNDSLRTLTHNYLRYKYTPPINLGYDIKIPHGFCDTTIDAGARFTDYLWNTGESTQTISVNQTGQYSVTVTDIFGFESVDSIMVYYPELNQLSDSTICLGDTISWDIGLNHYYNFAWQDASIDSLIRILEAGEYYVQITDTFGCVFNSDTAQITVDHYPETTSLGVDRQLCAGQSLYLETGATETVDYLWNDSSTNDHIIVEAAGDYSVTATNNIGCIAKDTINIQIQGYAPLPGFYYQDHCLGDLTNFIDTSLVVDDATIVAWNWDLGDLTTSTEQHPTHTYTDTGNYQISLHIIVDNGCENNLLKDIRIYSNPEAQFYTNQLCQNYLVNFVNTSTSAMGAIDYTRWDFGNNDTTNETSTQHFVSEIGDFDVQLKVRTIDGCENSFDSILTIKPSPIAGFSYSALCVGEMVNFYDESEISGVLSIINWQWETSNGGVSTLSNPTFNFPNSEYIQVLLNVKSINGCTDTISKNLWVYTNPTASFSLTDACLNNSVIVQNQTTDSQSSLHNYYWWLNSSLISQLETPEFSVSNIGNHKLKLKAISFSGCQDTLTKFFSVHPLPIATYTVSEDYTTPDRLIEFTANSIDNNSLYKYNFADGNSQNLPQVTHAYVDSGYYYSKLIVQNQFACIDSSELTIRIVEPLLDLAISQLETIDKEGKTKISILLSNIGNLRIDNITFRIEMSGQSVLDETFSGKVLEIGESLIYELNTQFLFSPSTPHYLCLTANVNSIYQDINIENNIECLSHQENDNILKIYPNPVIDEFIIIYRADKNEEISYKITDALGKTIISNTISVKKGIYKYPLSAKQLARGIYMIEIGNSIKKIIKE